MSERTGAVLDRGATAPEEGAASLAVDSEKIKAILKVNDGARMRSWLSICSRCGLCADSCLFYLGNGKDPKLSPAYKAWATLGNLYRQKGLMTREDLEEIKEIAFGQCTVCRRCSQFCPFGIDIAVMIAAARACLNTQGLIPGGLKAANDNIVRTGNQMAMSSEDFIETCDWMAEEYEEETKGLVIPMDAKGAKYLYTVNPREPMYYPQDLGMAAQIFTLAEESWTMSSTGWDCTNLAMFCGDKQTAAIPVKRMYDAATDLGVEAIIITECGHALRSAAYEGPYFLDLPSGKPPVPVIHAVELYARYIREGAIEIDPARKLKNPVTVQDPCSVSRMGGNSKFLRELMGYLCEDFRDMNPNEEYNHCCGGGGGWIPMGPSYRKRRMISGKVKAEQIKRTGATHIVVPCHNCYDQITDLEKEYELGLKLVTFKELILESCAVPGKFVHPETENEEAPAGAEAGEAGEAGEAK